MIATQTRRTLESLADAATRFDLILVPGYKNSGAEHWQSLWQLQCPQFLRIAQRRWDNPDIELWIAAIQRLINTRSRPVVLIGHSLGALASSCLAAGRNPQVAGLVLVAPAEPMRFEAEDLVPQVSLDVPSVVVASRNDPIMDFRRARFWSETWKAELVDLGEAGHINCEAGFGPWRHGLDIVVQLIARIEGLA